MEDYREKLRITYTTDQLLCRDQEYEQIKDYVMSNLKASASGTLYVSGMPGTGKTACVLKTIGSLNTSSRRKNSFNFIVANGMELGDVSKLFLQMHDELFGSVGKNRRRSVSLPKALESLKDYFLDSDTNHGYKRPTVLVLDELDVLINKKQRLLYSIFDWASKDCFLLTVIAIANTLDLPERALASRTSSRFGLNRLCFQPYTHDQIETILAARLQNFPYIQPDTLKLISRKVASISGDLRRALELCRLAFDSFLRDYTEDKGFIPEKHAVNDKVASKRRHSSAIKFSIKHAEEVLKQIACSVKTFAVKSASKYEILLPRAALLEYNRTGCEETTSDKIYQHYNDFCHSEGLESTNYDTFVEMLFKLGELRLIVIEYGREHWQRKVRLNINPDELSYILKSV